jgi:hypothetical protein
MEGNAVQTGVCIGNVKCNTTRACKETGFWLSVNTLSDSNVCGIITLCNDTVSDTDVYRIRLWWPEIRWIWFNCKRLISFNISTKNALSKTQIIKYSFILLSLFAVWCVECKNVHDVSSIKDAFLYSHLLYVFTLRNNLLTPWSRVLFEMLTGSQLVKKFPTFYGTRSFIGAFMFPQLIKESVQVRGLCEWLVTWYFLQFRVVNTSPYLEAGRPPLVGCPLLLIKYIRR